MNFRRSIRREEPEINFIPLIDLLLVILIFLMVTTTYNRYRELAVDLPSGIDADTGRVLGAAVRANRTVTFHRMKRGLELAPEYAGTVTVAPIGIPGPEIPCVALPSGP